MNAMSHCEQHRRAARGLVEAYASLGRKPTPDEYRTARRDIADQRREEQRQVRIFTGRDRKELRRQRRLHP